MQDDSIIIKEENHVSWTVYKQPMKIVFKATHFEKYWISKGYSRDNLL